MCTHTSRHGSMGPVFGIMSLLLNLRQDVSIVFQASNPKRRRTEAWGRYEKYKVATTYGQARQLGATARDMQSDVHHGFASVGDHLGQPAATNEATNEGQLGTTEEGMDIVHELDSERSWRPRDPDTHGGDSHSEEDVTTLKAELATLRKDKESLQHSVAELQKQVEQLPKLQTHKEAPGIFAGASQHKAQSIAGASSHGRPPFLDLAVRACEQGLANHHLLGEQPQRMKNVCVWMEWMNSHVSPELVSGSSPRVLAALLLHTAWCMEWGDGLPFSKTLVKLVALTRDGPQSCKQLQDGFLFHVMRFLKLTAEDCKDLAGLHCRLLMGLPGTQKGLPKLED